MTAGCRGRRRPTQRGGSCRKGGQAGHTPWRSAACWLVQGLQLAFVRERAGRQPALLSRSPAACCRRRLPRLVPCCRCGPLLAAGCCCRPGGQQASVLHGWQARWLRGAARGAGETGWMAGMRCGPAAALQRDAAAARPRAPTSLAGGSCSGVMQTAPAPRRRLACSRAASTREGGGACKWQRWRGRTGPGRKRWEPDGARGQSGSRQRPPRAAGRGAFG